LSTTVNQPADAELMARVAADDMAALGDLVRRHQGKVLALAIRTLGRPDLAEDVAQDVFVKVYRAAPAYTPQAAFTTWLYRIVVNCCLDALRKHRRAAAPLDRAADVPAADDAAGNLERNEQAARVRRALNALPERQRLVVLMHRYQDLSHRQIAETTGWSESAVESLLVRAYANLRAALADLET
jgi:RNA polymerase sigma-70 factor (ECF subfamily)